MTISCALAKILDTCCVIAEIHVLVVSLGVVRGLQSLHSYKTCVKFVYFNLLLQQNI